MIVFWGGMRGLYVTVGFLKLSPVIEQEDFGVNRNVMLATFLFIAASERM